jgi:hypothetical protein
MYIIRVLDGDPFWIMSRIFSTQRLSITYSPNTIFNCQNNTDHLTTNENQTDYNFQYQINVASISGAQFVDFRFNVALRRIQDDVRAALQSDIELKY